MVRDFMNRPKINLLLIFTFYIFSFKYQVLMFSAVGFPDILKLYKT